MRNRKKPGILGSFIKALADMSEKEAKKRTAQGNTAKYFPKQGNPYYKQKPPVKQCQFWDCNKNIRANHFLCAEHYEDFEDYVIDKCPECGRYKDIGFDVCKECYSTLKKKSPVKESKPQIRVEHSKAWEKGDQGIEKFFVYILKNDIGEFYAGHTRDLRVRLGEHRDGKTKSTSGKNLALQYFETVNNRKAAELKEVEFKKLINSNERKVRKMIQDFQDLHREIQVK
ncbi:GIY-YIG nuclease family protein [Chloroflexota bacterium]